MPTLTTTIIDVKRISPYSFDYLVSLQFERGQKGEAGYESWRKPFKVSLDHAPTMEEFKEKLRHVDPTPNAPADLLEDAVGKSFEVEFVPKREN